MPREPKASTRKARRTSAASSAPKKYKVSLSKMTDYRFETMSGREGSTRTAIEGITASWDKDPGSSPKHFLNINDAATFLNIKRVDGLSSVIRGFSLETTAKPPMTLGDSIGFRDLPGESLCRLLVYHDRTYDTQSTNHTRAESRLSGFTPDNDET
jgi:hypothetical protein